MQTEVEAADDAPRYHAAAAENASDAGANDRSASAIPPLTAPRLACLGLQCNMRAAPQTKKGNEIRKCG